MNSARITAVALLGLLVLQAPGCAGRSAITANISSPRSVRLASIEAVMAMMKPVLAN